MKKLLFEALNASIKASKEVLNQYENGFSIEYKPDKSPITSADKLSHDIILKHLQKTGIPILSEESQIKYNSIPNKWDTFWCIDPIDGTNEFINKTDEYCISIGLIDKITSYIGVLIAPSLDLMYFACNGLGSFKYQKSLTNLFNNKHNNLDDIIKDSIQLSIKCKKTYYTLLTSKSYFKKEDYDYYNKLNRKYKNIEYLKVGSAIKFGLLAEGLAHEYTRFSPLNFWDIAAGHSIVKYAGLPIISLKTNKEINYLDKNIKINDFYAININKKESNFNIPEILESMNINI